MSEGVLSLARPSAQAEMISERYLERERVRISWMNVLDVEPTMAVRRRRMNAVFFFREDSREFSTGKTSSRSGDE